MIGFLKSLLGLSGEGIGPHEAVHRLNAGALLVDVREPGEFAAAHAAQARSLPLSQIHARGAPALQALDAFEAATEVLLICQSGMRSRLAQRSLASDTRRRYVNVNGGMGAWIAAGLPIRRSSGR